MYCNPKATYYCKECSVSVIIHNCHTDVYTITFSIVAYDIFTVGLTTDALWEYYGEFVIPFSMNTGWDQLLRALGYDLKVMLTNEVTMFAITRYFESILTFDLLSDISLTVAIR